MTSKFLILFIFISLSSLGQSDSSKVSLSFTHEIDTALIKQGFTIVSIYSGNGNAGYHLTDSIFYPNKKLFHLIRYSPNKHIQVHFYYSYTFEDSEKHGFLRARSYHVGCVELQETYSHGNIIHIALYNSRPYGNYGVYYDDEIDEVNIGQTKYIINDQAKRVKVYLSEKKEILKFEIAKWFYDNGCKDQLYHEDDPQQAILLGK